MPTYYVRRSTGNDGNNGLSTSTPFKTLKKAVSVLRAGDTLNVMGMSTNSADTYNTTSDLPLAISQSGRSDAVITVQAYSGHDPVLDGRARYKVDGIAVGGDFYESPAPYNMRGYQGGLFDVNGSYVTVKGLTIRGSMGKGVRIFPRTSAGISNVVVRDCKIEYARAHTLFMTHNGLGLYKIKNITIDGCKVSESGSYYPAHRAADPGVDHSAAVVFAGMDGGILRNSTIFNNWGEAMIHDMGIHKSKNGLIEDNIFFDNYKAAYLHATTNTVFQRNLVYSTERQTGGDRTFTQPHGLHLSTGEKVGDGTDNQIINNIFVGFNGRGLWVEGGPAEERGYLRDCVIANNTFAKCVTGISITVVKRSGMVLKNNLFTANTEDVEAGNYDGGAGWSYDYNHFTTAPGSFSGPHDVLGPPSLENVNYVLPTSVMNQQLGIRQSSIHAAAGDRIAIGNNYRILSDSNCRNAGTDLGALISSPADNSDFFGTLRSETDDIGAHEFGQAVVQADFEAAPLTGEAPLTVNFQDKSTASSPITSWLWDFGDGTISGQQNPTHVFNAGTFSVSLRVDSAAGRDLVTKENLIQVTPASSGAPPRITDGLVVLYRFDQGSGQTIFDVSGEGTPLDLQVVDAGAIQWLAEGLAITSPTVITSSGPADKLIEACRQSNEISLEAWLKPANTTQKGPARIISVSQNVHSRNVTLGQGLWGSLPGNLYDVRLRTTERSANGMPSFSSPEGSLKAEKTHVMFTRDRGGSARIFLNGSQVAETLISGDFSTWNPRFSLLLTNETTRDYPWLGELYLVAAYERALSASEVQQNFEAGSQPTGGGSGSPVLLPSFKRFLVIGANGNGNSNGAVPVQAYGVQYPDKRCVTCGSDDIHALTVHENIDAALRLLNANQELLRWLD